MTLNQLKKTLIAYFNTHGQINGVYYESDFDFTAERALEYPCVNIDYQGASIQDKMTIRTWKVVFSDLLKEDNYDEIISDMEQVSEDFFTWAQNHPDFTFSKSVTLDPFGNVGGDITAGVVAIVRLSNVRLQNECAQPIKQNGPSNQTTIYYGEVGDLNTILTEQTIEGFRPKTIKNGWNIFINDFDNSTPINYFIAEPLTEPAKRSWYINSTDNGGIGVDASNLFGIPFTVGKYRVYATSYLTQVNTITLKKDLP